MHIKFSKKPVSTVYGNGFWNAKMRFMMDTISESEARRRYEEKDASFSVAVGGGLITSGEEASRAKAAGIELPVPDFVVSFFGGEEGLRLYLFEAHGSVALLADFERIEPYRLFLSDLITYEYPHARQYFALHDAVTVIEYKFSPDGYSQQITQCKGENEIEVIRRLEVPVDWLWVPAPDFGHWASIGHLLNDSENFGPAPESV